MTEKTVLDNIMGRYDEAWSADPNIQEKANAVHTLQRQKQMLLLKEQQLLNKVDLTKAELKFDITQVGTAVGIEARRTDVIEETVANESKRTDVLESDVDQLKQTVAELQANQVAQPDPVIITQTTDSLGVKEQECVLKFDLKFKKCYDNFWDIKSFKEKAIGLLKQGKGKWYRYDDNKGTHHIILEELVAQNIANGTNLCVAQTSAQDKPKWMKGKKEWRVRPRVTLRIVPSWFMTGVTGIAVSDDPLDNLKLWREYHNYVIANIERQGIASGSSLAYNMIRSWALNNAAANGISPTSIL